MVNWLHLGVSWCLEVQGQKLRFSKVDFNCVGLIFDQHTLGMKNTSLIFVTLMPNGSYLIYKLGWPADNEFEKTNMFQCSSGNYKNSITPNYVLGSSTHYVMWLISNSCGIRRLRVSNDKITFCPISINLCEIPQHVFSRLQNSLPEFRNSPLVNFQLTSIRSQLSANFIAFLSLFADHFSRRCCDGIFTRNKRWIPPRT